MDEAAKERADKAPAVARAIAILRLLAKSNAPLSLREIATTLDLVPSTGLHILRALVDESLVMVDPTTKRYQIGLGVLSLARGVLTRDLTLPFFRRELEALSQRFGVSTVATRIEHGHAITVATSFPPGVYSINTEVGSRYPDYMGTTGRCLAALGADPEPILERLATGRWHLRPTRAAWLREVEHCRRHGWTVDRGNLNAGVTVVAAPVVGSDGTLTHTIGAISVSEVAASIGIEAMGKALVEVARRAYAPG